MYVVAMNTYLPTDITDLSQWDSALYAFLAEKQRRSGSMRTVTAYSRMLQQFFGQTGCTPDRVTGQQVFAFAHGVGLSGKEPGPITINARISAISSFYRFLIRMQLVSSNPCDALERPRNPQSTPRGLSADEVRRLLAVIPDDEQGKRDRAVILTYLLTARRMSEVLAMVAGDISFSDGRPYYRYRGKGAKTGRRELPLLALVAMSTGLDEAGRPLETLDAHESLWLGLSSSAFYDEESHGRNRDDALDGRPRCGHVLAVECGTRLGVLTRKPSRLTEDGSHTATAKNTSQDRERRLQMLSPRSRLSTARRSSMRTLCFGRIRCGIAGRVSTLGRMVLDCIGTRQGFG